MIETEIGEHGELIIPKGAIRLSLDPSQGTGQFTEIGLSWFIANRLYRGIDGYENNLPGMLDGFLAEARDVINANSQLQTHYLGPTSITKRRWTRYSRSSRINGTLLNAGQFGLAKPSQGCKMRWRRETLTMRYGLWQMPQWRELCWRMPDRFNRQFGAATA